MNVGVSIQTVRTWEQGRSVPGIFSTILLRAFLEKDVNITREMLDAFHVREDERIANDLRKFYKRANIRS